jgi:Zn-dependent M32 family carboxypeptidase
MSTAEEKQEKISLEMAASASKGAMVEKIVFAGVPILFSCVVYLMSALSNANSEIIQLKSRVAVVVNADNKAIPPQGTTIDMAEIRENLSEKINSVEKEAALGRAAMTLDRERAMSAVEKNRLDMAADAAAARASIRMETVKAVAELDRRIAIIENRVK